MGAKCLSVDTGMQHNILDISNYGQVKYLTDLHRNIPATGATWARAAMIVTWAMAAMTVTWARQGRDSSRASSPLSQTSGHQGIQNSTSEVNDVLVYSTGNGVVLKRM